MLSWTDTASDCGNYRIERVRGSWRALVAMQRQTEDGPESSVSWIPIEALQLPGCPSVHDETSARAQAQWFENRSTP
jgi:hypothetical protein